VSAIDRITIEPSVCGRRPCIRGLRVRVKDVLDLLVAPRCGGRLRLLALLAAGAVTARILRHLGFPAEVPVARPARAPPLTGGDESW